MRIRSRFAALSKRALRSINGLTGALLGSGALVAYVVAILIAESATGRASPTQMAGLIVFSLPIAVAIGAVLGSLVGLVVNMIVSNSPLAGPVDRRMVVGGLALMAVVGGLKGVRAVTESESGNRPRVVKSAGTVTRLVGESTLSPLTQAMVVNRSGGPTPFKLFWRGHRVVALVVGETLMIRDSTGVVDRVSLDGLDYVREVHGATAALEGDGREWLALLVRLRATGRRELLLIYDPAGALAHQELLPEGRSSH